MRVQREAWDLATLEAVSNSINTDEYSATSGQFFTPTPMRERKLLDSKGLQD